jgi:hypothetical protein
MVLSLFSCEKNDEELTNQNESKDSQLNSDDTQDSIKQTEVYLRGVEILDANYFINIKSNDHFQPNKLYISNSLENETIIKDNIVSETEYLENGIVKSYKQQISDLENPLFYSYASDKVDLTHLEGGSYYSCDLPFVGEGTTSIHDFNKDLAYIISSSGEDTLFYEIKNGNVTKISTVEHVLYEYTYDDNPYFGVGIMYDFFSTEFDFKWWFVPEFIPKNNITSIKQYSYSDGGAFSTDEDEISVRNFSYDYNEYNYPIQIKMLGETLMRFFYDIK